MRSIIVVILFMVLFFASGCVDKDKPVVTTKITIMETDGEPQITQLQVETDSVNRLEEYRDMSPPFPCVALTVIKDMREIGYRRYKSYTGEGEYEITTDLRTVPDTGNTVDVIVKVYDGMGNTLCKKRTPLQWQ
ncbi:MAG: hypothetical protein EF812_02140 [Methanosarcinales archaeon]|nr:MAG: hypothetical protein EF812_02140 [Methanosarcinales archaeon]